MLEVQVLGPLVVRRDGAVINLKSPSQRLLLAILASEHPRAVRAHRLVDALWDDPPRTAERSLHSHLSRMRAKLGSGAIERVGDGYLLHAAVDAHHFGPRLERAMGAGQRSRVVILDEALTAWRGQPFGDLGDHRYLIDAASRLERARVDAAVARAEALLGLGEPLRALAGAEVACAEAPLHEGAWALRIQALATVGRTGEALRVAQLARDELAEVGLEPSGRLAAAESEAVSADRAPTTPPLPRPLSRIIGRSSDVQAVTRLLADHRCVTLVGPGGVGKTRLALEVAATDTGDTGGVWFCDLASLAAADVPASVARSIGAPLTEPIAQHLVEFASRRAGVLVLDNCEQVADEVATLLGDWLPRCDEIRVLATSRRRLAVDGERVFDVEPLDLETAIELFVARATDFGVEDADLLAVGEIVRRLDRLPLAIEMAAARARAIAVPELAARVGRRFDLLRDDRRPARQRTLDEVVAWSYEGLDPRQRRAFAALSVFTGAFSIEDAEFVLAGIGEEEAAALVAELCERSLLARSGSADTYRMLDTVRAGADRRLVPPDRGSVVVAHRDHFRVKADEIACGVEGPDELTWVRYADRALPNLRSAHLGACERGELEDALGIPGALFHYVYGRLRSDVAGWAVEALALDGALRCPAAVTAMAVAALGDTHADRLDRAADVATRAVSIAAGEPTARFAHLVLANVHVYRGELEAACASARASAAAAAAGDDGFTATVAMVVEAIAHAYAGRSREAEQAVAAARDVAGSSGSPTLAAYLAYADGERCIDTAPDRALECFEDAIAVAESAGATFALGAALLSATSVRARHGDPVVALSGYAATIGHWLDRGDDIHVWMTLRNLAVLLDRVGDDEAAALLLACSVERTGGVYGAESERLAGLRSALDGRLGRDRVDTLIRRGRLLDLTQAVELASARIDVHLGADATAT